MDLCRRWRIRELSVFGSVARGSSRIDSDVDLLVTFDPDAPWSTLDIVDLREELASLVARSKKEYVPPKRIAVLYVMLGENDRAMEWLQKTIDEHSQSVMTFKVDPRLARIQSYPPFKEMLRRLGLEPM